MNVRELSTDEIQTILSITDEDPDIEVNKRKNFYQDLVVNEFIRRKYLLADLFTRAGKSYVTLKVVTRYRKKFDNKICIVAPSIDIISMWKKLLAEFENIDYYVVNTYTLGRVEIDKDYGMFIVDEVDQVLNQSSQFFSTTIPLTRFDYLLCLSGSMSFDKIKFLETFGVQYSFRIPLEKGYLLGVVPEYITYNIPIQLSIEEKFRYIVADDTYNKYIEMFSKFSKKSTARYIAAVLQKNKVFVENQFVSKEVYLQMLVHTLKLGKGEIFGVAQKWREATSDRMTILNNSEEKFKAIIDFTKKIDDKMLIFVFKIEHADYLATVIPDAATYHSKNTKKQKEDRKVKFESGELKYLIACKSLDRNFTTNAAWLVRIYFDSTIERFSQNLGRLMMKSLGKVSRMINFYFDDFELVGKKYISQDKMWIIKSQRKQPFIEYIKSTDEIQI